MALLQPRSVFDLNRLMFLVLILAIWLDRHPLSKFLEDASKLMLFAHVIFYAGLLFDYLFECQSHEICGDRFLSGTFGNINMAAEYILMGMPFYIYSVSRQRNWKFVLALGCAFVYLCISQNRSAILASVVMLFMFALNRKRSFTIAAVLCIGALMFTIASPAKMWSVGARLELLLDTLKMIADHPLGVGRGAYLFVIAKYQALGGHRPELNTIARHPHNEFLSLIAEDGWLFAILLFSALVAVTRKLNWPAVKPYGAFLGSVAVGMIFQCLFQFPFENAFPFLMTALSCGIVFRLGWPLEDRFELGANSRLILFLALGYLLSTTIFAQVASMQAYAEFSPRACSIKPTDPRVCAMAIAQLEKNSDFKACDQLASHELERFPDFAPYLMLRARCRLNLAQPELACRDLDRSLELAWDASLEAFRKASCPIIGK